MRNFIAEGCALAVLAPVALTEGQGIVLGSLFGVSASTVVQGDLVALHLTGVHTLPKIGGQAWSVGAPICWDVANARCTTVRFGNVRIGSAAAAVGSAVGETLGRVRLNGGVVSDDIQAPAGLGWTQTPFVARRTPTGFDVSLTPRNLVNPAIWTGAAIHVDPVSGADGNSGLGAADGDFTNAKRNIHAAITAGNATGAPYRVILKPGTYENSSFSNNGTVEPNRPLAILAHGGRANYRAGPRSQAWTLDTGTTYNATITAVTRLFRADVLTAEGLYTELVPAVDLASCRATPGTWFKGAADLISVNLGKVITSTDVVIIRAFHGARFLTHAADLYLENLDLEGGITGSLHCDAIASRNIVGVSCTFRYSAPSAGSPVPLDAVQIRRTAGLVAFFDCDASAGAKDGWNFHADGTSGMHVLLVRCTGWRNGALGATSVNTFTTHDDVVMAMIGGRGGLSKNGSELHCIEDTRTWCLGTELIAADVDGTSTAFKVSNNGRLWLEGTIGDATGAAANFAVEANDGGTVYRRGHLSRAGSELASNGGVILDF